jgi:hypothetical protein
MKGWVAVLVALFLVAATPLFPQRHKHAKPIHTTEEHNSGSENNPSVSNQAGAHGTTNSYNYYSYDYYYPAEPSQSPPVWFQELTTFILILFTGGLWVTSIWQWKAIDEQARLTRGGFVATHRPHLTIRHIALITDLSEAISVDEATGTMKGPVEIQFAFFLNNRGATSLTVVEGNVSFRRIGGEWRGLADALQQARHRSKSDLPPLDRLTGIPAYEGDRGVLQGMVVKADHEELHKPVFRIPISQLADETEATRVILSLNPETGIKSLKFFAFGYFRYEDLNGRRYTTAFCQFYDSATGEFTPVEDRKYEYQT